MNILWFTNTPSNFGVKNIYNGGGWISSLEEEITKRDGVSLGVCFWLKNKHSKTRVGNVCYYPLYDRYSSFIGKIRKLLKSSKDIDNANISQYLKVIEDFKPDVITVFGTEQDFGLISSYVKIPVVIYIQGVLNLCLNSFFPPGVSLMPYVFSDFNLVHIKSRYRDFQIMSKNAKRELAIYRENRYFIGRTEWDKNVVNTYSRNSVYYHCDEILRFVFYKQYHRTQPEQLIITTTLSAPLYKGIDVVIKTSKVLNEFFKIPFKWNVYGNVDKKVVKSKLGTYTDNIVFQGVASAEQLKDALLNSTVYVHTSYIENSPNSLCEAQILACPVVAQNVGGIPTLIKDRQTGYLVPVNDPVQMACAIYELYVDKEKNQCIGENARNEALRRHDKNTIVDSFYQLYSQLTSSEK